MRGRSLPPTTGLKATTEVIASGLTARDQALVQNIGFYGGPTDSGERVTVDSSLQIGTVWACVKLIATTIATLPLHVFKEDAAGHGEIFKEHPLYRLLHDRPNMDMTSVEFWEATTAHILLWGNAYVGITRFGPRIVALTPMRPDRVSLRIEPNGAWTYVYTWNGKTTYLSEADVLHIKGFSLDGYFGLSAIEVGRNGLGSVRAAEKASAAVFRNGMRPSGVAKAKEYLTQPQREQARAMIENYSGAMSVGKVPLLEGGWDFVPLTIPPNDAQMLETRSFNVEEVCRWFEVPPIMIGHVGNGTTLGSSTEQIMLHFYRTCLRGHLKRIEQGINGKLLTPVDLQNGVYSEFVVEGLLRADTAARYASYSTAVQNGLMTRNEARALENLPADPDGDELTVQANLATLKNINAPPQPPPPALLGSQRQTSPQNGDPKPIPEIKQ
jgi:HK97 family phage portal protein